MAFTTFVDRVGVIHSTALAEGHQATIRKLLAPD
jgi:hypothetical protein